jgi:enoyl-CoA hydratase/carnithine racemase
MNGLAADGPASHHRMPPLTALRLEREPTSSVAAIVLDRPDRLNALSIRLMEELIELCAWLDRQHDIKVVVVRGEGRAFTAGFDLADFSGVYGGANPRAGADLGRQMAEALTGLRPLTIAAVHGHCVGGGVVIAASCDLRIAADDTRFSIPEVDLGIPLAWGGVPRLVRELGPAIAKELILTCRPFDAAEAHALRFVNRVVPADALEAAASELAAELATKPMFSITATKTQVNAVMEEIAGTGRNANDADTLVVALHDPESRAASARYLESRTRR